MLKGKALTILISTISLFVGLAAAGVGATFAWYSTHVADQTNWELGANGVLVLYFDDDPVTFTGELKPAVATKDKITQNETVFNVLTTGGNIAEAATTATATTYFSYLNGTAATSETAGKIGADITVSYTAKIIRQDDSEKVLSNTRDLAVTATFAVDYDSTDLEDEEPSEGMGESFHVDGDCRITIELTVYFIQPDDLIDPEILGAKALVVNITSVVEPDESE